MILNQSTITPNTLISIIIPSYNEERDLRDVLNCILQGENVEIIISDGGSHDTTPDIAREYCARNENVRYVTGKNPISFLHFCGISFYAGGRSRSQCQNIGALAAKGEILLFLHADTILPKGYENSIRSLLSSETNYYQILSFLNLLSIFRSKLCDWCLQFRCE